MDYLVICDRFWRQWILGIRILGMSWAVLLNYTCLKSDRIYLSLCRICNKIIQNFSKKAIIVVFIHKFCIAVMAKLPILWLENWAFFCDYCTDTSTSCFNNTLIFKSGTEKFLLKIENVSLKAFKSAFWNWRKNYPNGI